jgi:hypothetical protein
MQGLTSPQIAPIYGELIDSLPEDKSAVHNEQQLQIAKMIFKDNESTVNILARELRDSIVIALLFIAFESEHVNDLIKRFFPSANASYLFLVGIKCVLIVLCFYIIKNFAFSRK